jgi:hypothetical protein
MTKRAAAGCWIVTGVVFGLIVLMSARDTARAQRVDVPTFDAFYPVYQDFVGDTVVTVIRHKTLNLCMVQSMRAVSRGVGGSFTPGGLTTVPMEVCTNWSPPPLPSLER